ncbi:fimbria/pilus outer membrane usher protein [Erwinia typographi]|nr:fimbria/pilus outer membrane usher protein [Erwinia typographi]
MRHKHLAIFRLTVLATAVLCSRGVYAEELWFPPELVSGSGETVDLSQFESGGQMPGTYPVSVYLNRVLIETRDVRFVAAKTEAQKAGIKDHTGLVACLSREDLMSAGVKPEAFGDNQAREDKTGETVSPVSMIPDATVLFDFQQMRLDISIPHKWVQKRPRNWVPPERWDNGIPAALLNWSFSGTDSRGRYGSSSNHYLRLNSGINAGPWRLRDGRTMSDYRSSSYHSQQWRHGRTWLERGIIPWRSTLTMGDTVTEGDIFDSAGIRGVKLRTDDSMYPEQERGYAPVIRGTAMSNARVSIRQNGYVMYETNVSPGEFEIDDINPMYSSGDLEVTVTEADGGVRIFTVPYATVPNLLREGRVKYALSGGQLYDVGHRDGGHPEVLQGTLAWGLPHGMTAFGGMQFTRKYQAAALGAGLNMGSWGAVSADVTHADSTLADGSRHRGQSVRFLYSRGFESTGTTFQLAGYRYSTRGFYTLDESHRPVMRGWRGEQLRDASGRLLPRPVSDWYDLKDNRRERMDINVSQRAGDRGSLYLTGSRQTYWHGRGTNTSLQAGYSSLLGPVSYSLSYSESHSPSAGRTDRGVNLSLSVPLERLFSGTGQSTYASFSAGRDSNGDVSQQAGLSGTALELNNLSWNVSQGYSRQSGNTGSVRLGYRGGYGDVSAGYSQGRDYHQVSYDAAGGLILHSGGLTAGQPLGNTSVLVAVPGTSGVPLEGGTGVITDWRGYAVQPWAGEFRENRVALDVVHLDAHTEVAEPVKRVVPTRGAIVRADFAAKTGLRVLMTLMRNGKPLPFGAMVNAGESSGIVGEEGQVYLSGLPRSGTLKVKWGSEETQMCQGAWSVSENRQATGLLRTTVACQ